MSQEDFQQQVLRRFDEYENFQKQVITKFKEIDKRFDKLDSEISEANVRINAYQRSSTQVVNLAFGLISAAAVVILSPAVKSLSEFFLSK
jgi:sugar-specific transcriptional regulator TrmB